MNQQNETRIALFQNKEIRKTIYQNEWWFSVYDVVDVLTESKNPREYFNKILQRDEELKSTYGQFVHRLPLVAEDGKIRDQICANTEGIFRIIQSIPSPKAEPFKRWLAKVGYERVQEIENPELGAKRTRALYKAKGYSDDWIEKRMHGIEIREGLTEEWQEREIKEGRDFSILTAEISKATFDMTPNQYKKHKNLKRENLRDHMTSLELIFNMLGEKVTTEISKQEKPETFDKNKQVAKRGGNIAGNARKETEKELGRTIISNKNYIKEPENKKQLS
ncbi:MAG: Bro-N domain-containing protein [Patescibacteria group bacterium]